MKQYRHAGLKTSRKISKAEVLNGKDLGRDTLPKVLLTFFHLTKLTGNRTTEEPELKPFTFS